MTEFRTLELRVISGQDLKDVKLIGKMKTYVVAYVHPLRKFSTHLDKGGGKNPVWDEKLAIPVEEQLLTQQAVLSLEIYSHGTLGPKLVGSTQIPLSQAASVADKSDSSGLQRLDLQIRRPSGRIQGSISISFQLGERISVPVEQPMNQSTSSRPVPVTAYPTGAGYAPSSGPYPPYPPPQYQYPAAGYPPAGYPQPNYYPPAPPPGRSRFGGGGGFGRAGGGMGTGLMGGLLGGFLLGDLIGSASNWGDGGGGDYGDGGGGDYGGGDFGGGDFGGGF